MASPQPVPPVWKDVGKSSNDLLSKDFPIDRTSLEVKTRTPSNVSFRVFGDQHAKNPNVINAELEAKYQDKLAGITFTQSWTTHNALKTTVEVDDKFTKGVKLELATSLTPAPLHSEKAVTAKSTLLTATWKQPGIHSRAVLDLFKGPTFTADAVLGRDGFLVGLEGSYNVSEGRLTRYATALGFSAPEYAVTLHGLGNLSTFSASYYHRVNKDVEAGAKAIWDSKATTSSVNLEVAAKAHLDSSAFIKTRINNAGILSLAYSQALRPGVRASVGLALDTQRLADPTPAGPPHKVGASFVFEA